MADEERARSDVMLRCDRLGTWGCSIDAHYLNLLRDPETHEALALQADGLVNIRSGMRYALGDRIPDFLGAVFGRNKKYQEFYDRIARFYDLADKPYRWLKGKRDFRREPVVAATMIITALRPIRTLRTTDLSGTISGVLELVISSYRAKNSQQRLAT